MSVDYRAKLIFGYKITEEQRDYIEEHYDIVQEVRAKYVCAIDTWCVMEHSYFFGVQLASLDLEYDEIPEDRLNKIFENQVELHPLLSQKSLVDFCQ